MEKFRKVTALLLVMALTAVLGACSDSKTDADSGRSQTGESQKEDSATANATLNIGIAQDLDDSLDPHKMAAAGTREVLFNVFEGLVKPDYQGNIIPAVADSYDVSESGDIFTFTLREDVKFHDGSDVTVGDVVYSINRCAGIGTGETVTTALGQVESVEAPDEKTVVIKTAEPDIEFLSYLTVGIIPESYGKQETAPVGTGPYKFLSRTPQESIVLERFDDYWGETPSIETLNFKIIESADAMMMALRGGSLDFCAHLTASQAAELGDDFEVLEGTMNLVQAVYLNNEYEPLENEKVRQAISHAIDRDEIMQILSDGRGTAVGSSMYPAFTKYFVPELADTYDYNPDKSRSLLEEAGYSDGFSLELAVPSNYQPHVDTATVVVEQLRQVGIDASIRRVEWATWLSDIYTGREFEATVVGVDASAMTARAMLERFKSDHDKNFINFASPEYDRLLEDTLSQTDDAKQTQMYKELQEILARQAASAYIQDLCDMVAMKKGLTGFEFYPMYVLDFSKLHWE